MRIIRLPAWMFSVALAGCALFWTLLERFALRDGWVNTLVTVSLAAAFCCAHVACARQDLSRANSSQLKRPPQAFLWYLKLIMLGDLRCLGSTCRFEVR